MNFRQWLVEMPITNLQFKGDWPQQGLFGTMPAKKPNGMGYNKQDLAILGSPTAVQKIQRKWSNTKEDFNLVFLRQAGAAQHLEQGEVTPEWIKQNLHFDFQPDGNAINVIFTNNRGDEKMPMTAWTMAHRIGHAIARTRGWAEVEQSLRRIMGEILRDVYHFESRFQRYRYDDDNKYSTTQVLLLSLANAIGSFKSARDNNIRNYNELHFELLAQYMLTGKIVFRPLPRSLGSSAFGRPTAWSRDENERKKYDERLEYTADEITSNFDYALGVIIGKTFVM